MRANPIFGALAESPRVLLSVADDWAFIPSSWKAIGDEDPALGIPTTYYGAVQLAGTATVHDERTAPGSVAAILRRQLGTFQPEVDVADPGQAHRAKLLGILGISIDVEQVSAKFKYGGNVDEPHRRAVVERLRERGAPGDDAAAALVLRRMGVEPRLIAREPRRRARRAGQSELFDGRRQIGQCRRHLLLGMRGAVVTGHPGEDGEPPLALVHP